MLNVAQHTIYLQDGTRCNFQKQFVRQKETLFQAFTQVTETRSKQGKRHSLSLMLLILLGGLFQGSTTLKDCHLWALHNSKWLKKLVGSPHGIPDPTTISRAIQKVDMDSLTKVYTVWQERLFGKASVASFDGKTLNGVHGTGVIKHILSLFTHETHHILGQVGVAQKENEIPAAKRLFAQVGKDRLSGMLLLGDGLHTQKDTIKHILRHEADYLLFAKGNQQSLFDYLALYFTALPFKQTVSTATYADGERERDVTTTVLVSHEKQICQYLEEEGWEDVQTIGKIHRTGKRKTSDGKEVLIDEVVYCLSSRDLSAEEMALHIRNHWSIENNLHWQKDYTFLEDRHTLRKHTAPQVMTFLRSICISLCSAYSFASITTAVANFQKNPSLHHLFLASAGVI